MLLSAGADFKTFRKQVEIACQAGASGYLVKDCAFDELVTAIHAVVKGHSYLSPEATDILLTDYLAKLSNKTSQSYAGLTVRECQILKFIAGGMSTKKIATALDISIKTVETHRRKVMVKLGLDSVAELTKFAIREGLTSMEN